MVWKPLHLSSEQNNAALVTVVISVMARDAVNDFLLNHTIKALVHNYLKLILCVVTEIILVGMKKHQLS